MTDLEIIEQALKTLLKRMKEAEEQKIPATIAKGFRWLLEAIDEVKKDRLGQASELVKKQEEMEVAMKEYELAVKARKE